MPDIHVKIIKKHKDSTIPDHIIVEKKNSNELAHLCFDKGTLRKFIYIIPTPLKGRKLTSLPSYHIQRNFDIQNGIFLSSNSDEDRQSFFTRVLSASAQKRAIFFFDKDLNVAFTLRTDLEGKCQSDYFTNYTAEVKYIYSHQERRTSLPKNFFIKKER